MKRTIAVVTAVLMLVTLLLTGTVMAADQEELVGEWHIKNMKQGSVEMDASLLAAFGQDMVLTLNEDGTATQNMSGEIQEGTWSLDGEEGVIVFGTEAPFVLKDGDLVIGTEDVTMTFSKEEAEAYDTTLAPAVEDTELSDFDGEWNATVYVALGAPLPLSVAGAEITLVIEEGKVTVFETVMDLNSGEVVDSMEIEFAAELEDDGTLFIDFDGENILEKIGMEASGISLTLHEDGRMSGTTPEILKAVETLRALSEANGTSASGEAGLSVETYLLLERAE